MSSSAPLNQPRLQSLDQFRGYTVAGMWLVNFMGGYAVCPQIWKHSHTYCSYADTIMPQFLFAAGFALRLSFLKHLQHGGGREAWLRMLRRAIGLSLIAIIWYSYGDWQGILRNYNEHGFLYAVAACAKRTWMQTLLHIALTCIWILPVISASVRMRVAYAAVSGILHVVLSAWFNFMWVNNMLQNGEPIPVNHLGGGNGIDGGPFGFLTWCIPAIAGTWAYDVVQKARSTPAGQGNSLMPAIGKMLAAGVVVALLGWVLSCGTTIYDVPDTLLEELKNQRFARNPVFPSVEQFAAWNHQPAEPPFCPPPDTDHRKLNYWMMSQRSGSLSYPTFAAGFALIVMALFVWAVDVRGWTLGIFRTLGMNALAAYMMPGFFAPFARSFSGMLFGELNENGQLPKTASALPVAVAFGLMCLMLYIVLRIMEWRKIYIRM